MPGSSLLSTSNRPVLPCLAQTPDGHRIALVMLGMLVGQPVQALDCGQCPARSEAGHWPACAVLAPASARHVVGELPTSLTVVPACELVPARYVGVPRSFAVEGGGAAEMPAGGQASRWHTPPHRCCRGIAVNVTRYDRL